MTLLVHIELVDGKVPPNADIPELNRQIIGHLEAVSSAHSLKLKKESTPAPDDALGAEPIISYIVENFEQIIEVGKNLSITVRNISSLVELYLKQKNQKDDNVVAYIQIGDERLDLPAGIKEINDFVAKHEKLKGSGLGE